MKTLDSYEHLIGIAQNPATAKVQQDEIDRQRFERVLRANRMRPQYLAVKHDLPGVPQSTAYSKDTDELKHDCVVWAAMTDGENRRAKILRDRDQGALPIVRLGNEGGINLTLEAIAGESVTTTAHPLPQKFPNPYSLRAGQVLTLDLFQETNVPATVNTVFLGTRPLRSNADDAMLSSGDIENVRKEIAARRSPETKFSVAKVVFDGGEAVANSPKSEEPLLVLGFRATFGDAMINFGFDTDSQFAKKMFPIWALAPKKQTAKGMFLRLREEIFIPPQQQLVFSLRNTINGVNFAENGQIEILLSTV
ncbi:MAG TPA: hypothetical protein VF692_01145 [Pyrinomonadaceae bacterium]|jgi:hypothetical protein